MLLAVAQYSKQVTGANEATVRQVSKQQVVEIVTLALLLCHLRV